MIRALLHGALRRSPPTLWAHAVAMPKHVAPAAPIALLQDADHRVWSGIPNPNCRDGRNARSLATGNPAPATWWPGLGPTPASSRQLQPRAAGKLPAVRRGHAVEHLRRTAPRQGLGVRASLRAALPDPGCRLVADQAVHGREPARRPVLDMVESRPLGGPAASRSGCVPGRGRLPDRANQKLLKMAQSSAVSITARLPRADWSASIHSVTRRDPATQWGSALHNYKFSH